MGKLDGKTALVIGASSGLGRAIALGYAREGAAIIAASRTPASLEALATEVQGLGASVTTHPFDATEPDAFPALDRWLDEAGRDFDVLVYTPGGGLHAVAVSNPDVRARLLESHGRMPFWQIEDAHFDQIMQVGVRAPVMCCKYLAPRLIRKGGGSMIFIGSPSGIPGQAVHSDGIYCAEKGALMSFVLFAAKELKPHGVAANVLLPGPVRTGLTRGYPYAENFPTMAAAEIVVPAAVFLAEQTADGVTGQMVDAREYAASTSGAAADRAG
jgi:3-oxoacyl-[acyl-carrier protein] reductase